MKTLRDLFRDYRFVISFIVLLLLVIMALLSFVCPHDITLWGLFPRDLKPSMEHWLGTDANGQDIFWNATFAVRNSLIISLIAGIISRGVAIVVGMVAGYKGGNIDRVLMFIGDSLLVIPLFLIRVLLSMLVRVFLNLFVLGLLLSFFGWAWDARLIRSMILSLRERDFTQTSILSGNSTLRLVLKEYMPFTTPLIFSTLINNMSWAIGLEMTLAILGLVKMSIPTLGTMLNWALQYQAILLQKWNWILTPVVLSVFLL